MRKTTRFKELLHSPELEFLLEAHNGISARIGEEAGFRGLWASGLCLSAQFGVRDSNEASWTQVLEMLEFMADATTVPILLDGDTGYGNFNNMRRLVRKLEQRGIAAVCIEDKLFPKTNSFLRGETQPLADPEEFCGKIQAGKEAQRDADFCIVARVEALIAGWGLGEALRRAEAYVDAGADAILIHSARNTADEVLAFQREWGGRAPVVIVPTKYYATPTDVFRDAGFSVAIWANHMMRGAIAAMQHTAAEIARSQNLLAVEDRVVPVAEVFRLQGADELREAEKRYLPRTASRTRAVVLAASRGAELGELTEERPKALVRVRGKPLMEHIVDAYNGVGVKDITVVRGYRKEAFDQVGLRWVDNDAFADTGELWSLRLALAEERGGDQTLVVSYGDVLFNRFLVAALGESEGELAVVVDSQWRAGSNRDRWADYVTCSEPDSRRAFYRTITLRRVDHEIPEEQRHGEWTGFLKVAPAALPRVSALAEELLADPGRRKAMLSELLNALIERGERIGVVYVSGHWLDVDSLADIERAGSFGVIDAGVFLSAASERGFRLFTGVPCSYLKPFINYVIDAEELRYVGAANEGDAVAIGAGAELGGVRSVVMFQNSGLGNAVNPLTSLTWTFRVPVLLIPTLRGQPGGPPDEPQHELMGRITTQLLELMEIPWEWFPAEPDAVAPALDRALDHMESERRPYALVMRKGAVAAHPIRSRPTPRPPLPAPARLPLAEPVGTRTDALRVIQERTRPDDTLLASTGYAGRELYALEDRPGQLYMVGSMGCVASLALGLALAQPQRRVVALDGDGALLMRMGVLATIGHERPPNLVHVLLDNQRHESTGGQATVSHSVDFPSIAAACGYVKAGRSSSLDELAGALAERGEGPVFLHVPIAPGVPDDLPRPSVRPETVAARLRTHLEAQP